ncbi:hypothetical protein [Bacillus sp. OV322]|uniref:hypothetical protein n=1 Tax=Bacillus sp. OV322 TaxID=1882764 RepID=UPI0015A5DF8A|nr:hypothetical protein [Bacillus sp. OV322]
MTLLKIIHAANTASIDNKVFLAAAQNLNFFLVFFIIFYDLLSFYLSYRDNEMLKMFLSSNLR